jgi:FMN phosphatase YigB (HAD superfamily)
MDAAAITMDFHNTLVECEPWFRLEVRSLPVEVLKIVSRHAGVTFSAVIFDSAESAYRKLRLAVHDHGHELPANRAVATVLESVGVCVDSALIEVAIESLMREALPDSRPVPGAAETVHRLATNGLKLGVVSSAVYHPFLLWALEKHRMLDHFDVVTTSASSGYYKSRPEIFWSALRALESSPEESAHLGDSLRFDVGGAAIAGMRTAWLRREGSHESPTDGLRPDLILDSLIGASSELSRLTDR